MVTSAWMERTCFGRLRLANEFCRVIFHEKVHNPQRVLQVPETGWWCLFIFINTACCQSALVPLVVLLGDIDHFASTQVVSVSAAPMLVPEPFFAVVSARTASAVTEVLPCPQSATVVHRRPVLRTFCVFRITPVSQANLQLRHAQCCDFCSDLRTGSCADVKKLVE